MIRGKMMSFVMQSVATDLQVYFITQKIKCKEKFKKILILRKSIPFDQKM